MQELLEVAPEILLAALEMVLGMLKVRNAELLVDACCDSHGSSRSLDGTY